MGDDKLGQFRDTGEETNLIIPRLTAIPEKAIERDYPKISEFVGYHPDTRELT